MRTSEINNMLFTKNPFMTAAWPCDTCCTVRHSLLNDSVCQCLTAWNMNDNFKDHCDIWQALSRPREIGQINQRLSRTLWACYYVNRNTWLHNIYQSPLSRFIGFESLKAKQKCQLQHYTIKTVYHAGHNDYCFFLTYWLRFQNITQ